MRMRCPSCGCEISSDETKPIIITTGEEFEQYLCGLINSCVGLSCEMTKASGDQGVDLVVAGGDKRIAVQCKLYTGAVGNDAVQQVMAGRVFYECDLACVVTNSTFTKSAQDLAAKGGVLLLHHEQLLDYLRQFVGDNPDLVLQESIAKKKAEAEGCGNRLMLMIAQVQEYEERAKRGDVDALLTLARDGLEIERSINGEIDRYKFMCEDLGLESEGLEHVGVLKAAHQSKEALFDLAKKGDAKAKSALFDLVKGRNGDPYVEDVLRKALQAKEEWVEPMRIGLGMYGIGSN